MGALIEVEKLCQLRVKLTVHIIFARIVVLRKRITYIYCSMPNPNSNPNTNPNRNANLGD